MVAADPWVQALLRDYPGHPYKKWQGAHWRLLSLVELGLTEGDDRIFGAVDPVLKWLLNPRRQTPRISGRYRQCASMDGNGLLVCCRLGMARRLRVRRLAEVLLRSQWPDGGWNCDVDPDARHSSFHETLAPIWGLVEYHRSTADGRARRAARRAGELLLEHHLFRRTSNGDPIHPEWLHIHWPHYWHYDFFHGLRAIAMLDLLTDTRADDAMGLLMERGRDGGTWRADGRRYWSSDTEVVDWGNAEPIVTAAAQAIAQ